MSPMMVLIDCAHNRIDANSSCTTSPGSSQTYPKLFFKYHATHGFASLSPHGKIQQTDTIIKKLATLQLASTYVTRFPQPLIICAPLPKELSGNCLFQHQSSLLHTSSMHKGSLDLMHESILFIHFLRKHFLRKRLQHVAELLLDSQEFIGTRGKVQGCGPAWNHQIPKNCFHGVKGGQSVPIEGRQFPLNILNLHSQPLWQKPIYQEILRTQQELPLGYQDHINSSTIIGKRDQDLKNINSEAI